MFVPTIAYMKAIEKNIGKNGTLLIVTDLLMANMSDASVHPIRVQCFQCYYFKQFYSILIKVVADVDYRFVFVDVASLWKAKCQQCF